MQLDPRPARTDLTNRECAKVIGGVLGMLLSMADINAVKEAVLWWADTPEAWIPLETFAQQQAASRRPK